MKLYPTKPGHCDSCKHYARPEHPEYHVRGDCRLHAPVVMQTGGRENIASTMWPQVLSSDWCGEWADKKGGA